MTEGEPEAPASLEEFWAMAWCQGSLVSARNMLTWCTENFSFYIFVYKMKGVKRNFSWEFNETSQVNLIQYYHIHSTVVSVLTSQILLNLRQFLPVVKLPFLTKFGLRLPSFGIRTHDPLLEAERSDQYNDDSY